MKKVKRIVLAILIALILAVVIVISMGYNLYKEAIEEKSIAEMVEEIQSQDDFTSFEELPEDYINAVIAVEDKRFYSHNGIDMISIGRAIVTDIKELSFAEGGSTITQQVAKNNLFTQDKTLIRKVAEVFAAFDIEDYCTKEEIFELYVNTCYFGDGYYTVKAASNGYFGVDPIDMTLYECTLLAGIPNAPSVYAPTKNPELAQQRQEQVLEKMIENGYLTEEEAEAVGY